MKTITWKLEHHTRRHIHPLILQKFSTYFRAFLHAQFSAVIDIFLVLFFEFWCPRVALVKVRQTLPTDGSCRVEQILAKKETRERRKMRQNWERAWREHKKRNGWNDGRPNLAHLGQGKDKNELFGKLHCGWDDVRVIWGIGVRNHALVRMKFKRHRGEHRIQKMCSRVSGHCHQVGGQTQWLMALVMVMWLDGDTNVWKDLNVMHEKTNDVRTHISIAQEQVGMSLRMGRRPATKHRKYAQKRNCIHSAFDNYAVCVVFFFLKKKKKTERDWQTLRCKKRCTTLKDYDFEEPRCCRMKMFWRRGGWARN